MKKLCSFLQENKLLNTYFYRTHCSFIVNIKYISTIKPRYVIIDSKYEDEIPISNSRRNDFYNNIRERLTIFKNQI